MIANDSIDFVFWGSIFVLFYLKIDDQIWNNYKVDRSSFYKTKNKPNHLGAPKKPISLIWVIFFDSSNDRNK